MSRIPALSDERLAAVGPLADQIRAQRQGRMPLLYRVLSNSPPVAEGWLSFFTALRQRSSLSKRTMELAILRVTQMFHAQHEFDSHVPFALRSGLEQHLIDALGSWKTSAVFNRQDRDILAYAEEVMNGSLQDSTFEAVAALLGEQELLELTVAITAYGMVSKLSGALRIGSAPH